MKRAFIILLVVSPLHAQEDPIALLQKNNAELLKRWEPDVQYPTWEEIRPQALAQRRSGVVFVGMPPRKVRGVMAASNKTFAACSAPCIAVAGLTDTWFDLYVLPSTATDDDILFVVQNRKVPQSFIPQSERWAVPPQAPRQYQQPMTTSPMMRGYQSMPMMAPRMMRGGRAGGC